MTDHEKPAPVGRQRVDECCGGAPVEVVGWLIQHQEVVGGYGEEQPRHRHPEPFTTREPSHRPVDAVAAQQETRQLCPNLRRRDGRSCATRAAVPR